jgi:hypothetical protein
MSNVRSGCGAFLSRSLTETPVAHLERLAGLLGDERRLALRAV